MGNQTSGKTLKGWTFLLYPLFGGFGPQNTLNTNSASSLRGQEIFGLSEFRVGVMLQKLPEEEFGTGIDFREYSFFDNPLLPTAVKESWLEVCLCEKHSPHCQITIETSMQSIRFPNSTSKELFLSVFSKYKDVKVIQFSSIEDAFEGFTDKVMQSKFRNCVNHYVGIWCCVENRERGHIFYDMYWDEKPGWKPVPPPTLKEDHPPWA